MADNRWWLPGLAAAALLAIALLFGSALGRGGDRAEAFSLDGLDPAMVLNYEFAAAHPAHVARIPCYCGCVGLEHASLLDCFVKPEGGWEAHASGCAVCGDEAGRVEAMLAQGTGIDIIRTTIIDQFGRLGRPTDTP
jgi:hypothetical protein